MSPSVHAVHRTCSAKMGQTTAVLHPAKQQRGAVCEQSCSSIKYAIDPIRPILAGQDWIGGMPMKESIGGVDGVDRVNSQVHRVFTNMKLIKLGVQEARESRATAARVQSLALEHPGAAASPEAPSRRTALTPLPGSRWPGQDEGHLDSRPCWRRTRRLSGRYLPGTN